MQGHMDKCFIGATLVNALSVQPCIDEESSRSGNICRERTG